MFFFVQTAGYLDIFSPGHELKVATIHPCTRPGSLRHFQHWILQNNQQGIAWSRIYLQIGILKVANLERGHGMIIKNFRWNIKPSQICRDGLSLSPRPTGGCQCRCARSPTRTGTLHNMLKCKLDSTNGGTFSNSAEQVILIFFLFQRALVMSKLVREYKILTTSHPEMSNGQFHCFHYGTPPKGTKTTQTQTLKRLVKINFFRK